MLTGFELLALTGTQPLLPRPWSPRRLPWRRRDRSRDRIYADAAEEAAWNLHMAARLANARLTGKDPPFETLRLVKERIGDDDLPHASADRWFSA